MHVDPDLFLFICTKQAMDILNGIINTTVWSTDFFLLITFEQVPH